MALVDMDDVFDVLGDCCGKFLIRESEIHRPALTGAVDIFLAGNVFDPDAFPTDNGRSRSGTAADHQMFLTFSGFLRRHFVELF